MFSWYQDLIVGLVFSHLGFWSGNIFLIAALLDLCLLVPFNIEVYIRINKNKTEILHTATKETSWILLTMTIKLMLSRLLIRLLGTSMTF